MRWVVVACALLVAAPLAAQVNFRPTDPPIVTAENDGWYRRGEPIVVGGEFYYPAGPVVFFNGDHMVRTEQYNGVPVYADTLLEPYSVLLVPIGRGQMQPYERLRSGELAGTSGSRPPSFPGRSERLEREFELFPAPPPYIAQVAPQYTIEPGAVATGGSVAPPAVDESALQPRRGTGRPFSYDSISVRFMGEKWVMAGPSGPLRGGLTQVAEYRGFPVYAEKGHEQNRIYLPIAPGRVAPFKPAER